VPDAEIAEAAKISWGAFNPPRMASYHTFRPDFNTGSGSRGFAENLGLSGPMGRAKKDRRPIPKNAARPGPCFSEKKSCVRVIVLL
jgi:hypothetical protein